MNNSLIVLMSAGGLFVLWSLLAFLSIIYPKYYWSDTNSDGMPNIAGYAILGSVFYGLAVYVIACIMYE